MAQIHLASIFLLQMESWQGHLINRIFMEELWLGMLDIANGLIPTGT